MGTWEEARRKHARAVETHFQISDRPRDVCPVCGKVPITAFKDPDRMITVFKHTRLVKLPHRSGYLGKVTQSTYCEAPL